MALALVAGSAGNNSGTGTTFTPTFTPTSIGQVAIVFLLSLTAGGGTASISDDQGNVYYPVSSMSSGPTCYVWWTIVKTAVLSTVTISLSASLKSASAAFCVSGADGTFPWDMTALPPGTATSTSPAGGNVTTSRANEFLIMAMIPAGGTITLPTGYTNVTSTGNTVGRFGYLSEASAGVYNPAWTLSTSNQWLAFNGSITPPFTHGSVIFEAMNS